MAEWWESDEKIHEESPFGIWWMATKKNRRNICPDWMQNAAGFGLGSLETMMEVHRSVGFNTSTKVIHGAGSFLEKGRSATVVAGSWCFGGYIGGGLDAFYQYHHGGMHLGTALTDWYLEKEHGVENFLIHLDEWWNSDNHWWE